MSQVGPAGWTPERMVAPCRFFCVYCIKVTTEINYNIHNTRMVTAENEKLKHKSKNTLLNKKFYADIINISKTNIFYGRYQTIRRRKA